jgi:DNA-binding NarL/FixJ family response regulator
MIEPVSVLIVDDRPRARQSMKALMATSSRVATIRTAENGDQAIRLIEQAQPNVVMMDVRMPRLDGLAATRVIKGRWPRVKVILLSIYSDYRADALAAGADAFVHKGDPPDILLSAFEAVLSLEA